MRRIVAFIVAVGMVVVFGGVALAGGGDCSFSTRTHAATDKADASKNVATKAPEKADADKVAAAQPIDKSAQPAPETKK
jgi:hypothetical protein